MVIAHYNCSLEKYWYHLHINGNWSMNISTWIAKCIIGPYAHLIYFPLFIFPACLTLFWWPHFIIDAHSGVYSFSTNHEHITSLCTSHAQVTDLSYYDVVSSVDLSLYDVVSSVDLSLNDVVSSAWLTIHRRPVLSVVECCLCLTCKTMESLTDQPAWYKYGKQGLPHSN